MAEAVFQQMVNEAGLADQFNVDSAGTSAWHLGDRAHHGTRQVLHEHGIHYKGSARQVTAGDMTPETTVVAMDESNLYELRRRFGDALQLSRLLDFAPDVKLRNVPDPYYSGNFGEVYQLVSAGCRGLLVALLETEGIEPLPENNVSG